MTYYLTMGIILGLSAGFVPGPLFTLMISETLQHDIKSGVKVALAPIVTDLPIILFSLFILDQLSNSNSVLGIISITGALFILYMGYESIRSKGYRLKLQEQKSRSLTKGILANALSPHPYLFWLSVGGPIMTEAMTLNIFAPLFFIGGFYIFLIGSKVLLAILVGKSKSFLSGDFYIYIMRFLGLTLVVLSFALFIDGLKMLGVLLAV